MIAEIEVLCRFRLAISAFIFALFFGNQSLIGAAIDMSGVPPGGAPKRKRVEEKEEDFFLKKARLAQQAADLARAKELSVCTQGLDIAKHSPSLSFGRHADLGDRDRGLW